MADLKKQLVDAAEAVQVKFPNLFEATPVEGVFEGRIYTGYLLTPKGDAKFNACAVRLWENGELEVIPRNKDETDVFFINQARAVAESLQEEFHKVRDL